MLYSEAVQFLYDLQLFGAKLGLENTSRLAAMAGDPQKQLRFVHVAGTNGKGSTCAMLESIYRTAGLRVGLFTSPHLVTFAERIQVNRQFVAENDVVRLVQQMQALLTRFASGSHPTFFEVVTVMALQYFVEQRCELVVWETGLGGRLDATNIVTPLASVITNIQRDHEKWLGATVPEIAAEKAGIIKPGIPVITAENKPEALRVISDAARRAEAQLLEVSWEDTQRAPLDALDLPLLGEHQRLNAALAVATVRTLGDKIPVSESAIKKGLLQTNWPGRLQIVPRENGQTIILDGAHNPDGVITLRAAMQRYFPTINPTVIFGVLRDKDWAGMCRLVAPIAQRILLTPVTSERTADAEALRKSCVEFNPLAEVLVCPSMSEALAAAANDPWVLVTGSLHFIGEAMEALQIAPSTCRDERGLNDWSITSPRTLESSPESKVPSPKSEGAE